jgi:hypothetical protein
MREHYVRPAPARRCADVGYVLDRRPREVVIRDSARYATYFLYNQRRPS